MKQNLHYFQTISHTDLRNAKFQGFLNDKQQRHGFGILLDDDLTLYLSEWQHDQLDGNTLILRIDGSALYGQFKNNNLYSTVLFKNSEYTILSRFRDGKSVCLSAAFDRNMANALIFNTSEITIRKTAEKSFYNRFLSLKEIRKQKEVIHKVAGDNNIPIATFQVQFLQFLKTYYKKYESYLTFIRKQIGGYYFGFKNGIGFQFSLTGSVHQKIQILSMGVYGKLRLLQVGVKNHKRRCYQQGRFNIKQTISYSNLLERPKKCKQMHQNLHKQSLNYLGKYFYLKDNFLDMFDEFIYRKLQQQFHEAISRCHQRKKILLFQKSPKKQSIIGLQSNRKKVVKNGSFTNLTNRNKQERDKSRDERSLLNDRSPKKDRSQQKVNKSLTKSASFIRSKPPTDIKPKKQLYINNYKIIRQNSQTNQQFKNVNHPKPIIRQSASPKKCSPSPLKNDQKSVKGTKVQARKQSIIKEEKDMDRNSITRMNQQKIRGQLHMNELNQKYHLAQRSPPLINQQLYRPHSRKDQLYSNINKILLSSKCKKDTEFQNQRTSIDFMLCFEQLERRRTHLLTDYRNLNSNSPHQRSIDNPKKYLNQATQIKQFTLIQAPLSHKENKNQQPQYSDRLRSRIDSLTNKGKNSCQVFQ